MYSHTEFIATLFFPTPDTTDKSKVLTQFSVAATYRIANFENDFSSRLYTSHQVPTHLPFGYCLPFSNFVPSSKWGVETTIWKLISQPICLLVPLLWKWFVPLPSYLGNIILYFQYLTFIPKTLTTSIALVWIISCLGALPIVVFLTTSTVSFYFIFSPSRVDA